MVNQSLTGNLSLILYLPVGDTLWEGSVHFWIFLLGDEVNEQLKLVEYWTRCVALLRSIMYWRERKAQSEFIVFP